MYRYHEPDEAFDETSCARGINDGDVLPTKKNCDHRELMDRGGE